MVRSRLRRVTAHLGLVENRQTAPRAGTTAWWWRLVPLLVMIVAVVVLLEVL